MHILALPDDILFSVVLYLSIVDVLALRQTCRTLHAFGGNDYLWHRLMSRFGLPLNLPTDVPLSSHATDILQQEAIKAIRLELNWRKPISHIHRSRSVSKGTREPYTHMQFLPGGKWLLTAQRYHRLLMTRHTTRMSVWSFDDVDNPHCVFRVELTGTYRSSALALKQNGASAWLVLGIEDDFQEFVEIRSISLREDVDSAYLRRSSPSPENWKRLELPFYPVLGDRSIQDVHLSEGVLVVTVAIFGEHNDISFHILLMDPEAGELRWVDPAFTKDFGLLQVRIQHGKMYLLEQRHSTNYVHVYDVPFDALDDKNSLLSRAPSVDTNLIDLGPELCRHTHSLPREVQSMADMLHVPRAFTSNIPVTMFDVSGFSHHSGYTCHYPFDADTGELPEKPVTSVWIPCRDDTSQQLVQIGTTGRRMVWMEHELETGRNRVMKFQMAKEDWEGGEKLLVVHGYLLPSEPNLPFALNACNCLAFDEVSGRLCLAFYDGGLHVLDFA
ncbi:hypothetical protein EIP91_007816 [Steccherinum ochraceum]|uniref:F-box domain-containing protein n=1 Tax=Steccherinum ochraceum TaxID=92696 RepID=A0A4V2MVC6_9APHY|nr:hypothetical protein EIP91_007816 [Steccherinum ochraceum]